MIRAGPLTEEFKQVVSDSRQLLYLRGAPERREVHDAIRTAAKHIRRYSYDEAIAVLEAVIAKLPAAENIDEAKDLLAASKQDKERRRIIVPKNLSAREKLRRKQIHEAALQEEKLMRELDKGKK
jgi:hypothetical protein